MLNADVFGEELVPIGSPLYCATLNVPVPPDPPLEASAESTAPDGVTEVVDAVPVDGSGITVSVLVTVAVVSVTKNG